MVDASVVLKALWDERDSDRARALLEAHRAGILDLTAPSLMAYEVSNAIRFSSRLMAPADRSRAISAFLKMRIRLAAPALEDLDGAIRVAVEHGVTAYDAAYYVLATRLGATLVTADERFDKRMRSADVVPLSRYRVP